MGSHTVKNQKFQHIVKDLQSSKTFAFACHFSREFVFPFLASQLFRCDFLAKMLTQDCWLDWTQDRTRNWIPRNHGNFAAPKMLFGIFACKTSVPFLHNTDKFYRKNTQETQIWRNRNFSWIVQLLLGVTVSGGRNHDWRYIHKFKSFKWRMTSWVVIHLWATPQPLTMKPFNWRIVYLLAFNFNNSSCFYPLIICSWMLTIRPYLLPSIQRALVCYGNVQSEWSRRGSR